MGGFETFDLIKQGAEARIYKGTYLNKSCVVKERFVKGYRHPELDNHLTKDRIRAECKAIVKCRSLGITTPTLYLVDLKNRSIYMEYFEKSMTAKEFIFNASDDMIIKLAKDIGLIIAKMHSNNLTHGDLTTSNVLVIDGKASFDGYDKLAVVDFGLAHLETSAEEKGVDLYVLERALLSTHSAHGDIFLNILKAYKGAYKNSDVISKFEEVRMRGRKRTMVG